LHLWESDDPCLVGGDPDALDKSRTANSIPAHFEIPGLRESKPEMAGNGGDGILAKPGAVSAWLRKTIGLTRSI
jgi:hypothetical protein